MSTTCELDRKHVFHSWSAQAEISPMVITAARGSYVWDDEDRRYLDFSSQLVFTNIGHQHPRVVAAIKEQADRLCTIAPAVRQRAARPGRGADRRDRARRLHEGVLHQRRRRRQRARRPHGAAADRPLQGADGLPQLSRRHPDRDQPDRRPAPLRQRHRDRRRRALLRAVPLPLGVPRDDRGGGVRARARPPAPHHRGRGPADDRGDPARDDPRHRRHLRAAAGLPPRRPRALRRARHQADPRRGDGRLRPRRQLARAGPVRRPPRPDHLRQGRELRLRPARRRDHQRRDRGDLRPHAVPRRAHLLRPPAGLRGRGRDHPHDARRGHRRERRPARPRDLRARPGRDRRAARLRRRGPRRRRLLGARPGHRPGHQGDAVAGRAQRRRRRLQVAPGCCPSPTPTGSTWCRRAR